jgi:hypothetical protein
VRADRHSQDDSSDRDEVDDNDSGDGIDNNHERGQVVNVSEDGEGGSRSNVDSVEETLSGSRSCTLCESSDQE